MSVDILHEILPQSECSDMKLVTRLRDIITNNRVDVANSLINDYSFWYDPQLTPERGLVFWSENHYIMSASSELLIREMLNLSVSKDLWTRIMIFLDIKNLFGTSEWLSPVYIPFTVAALLNLYDFAKDPLIKEASKAVLDRIAFEVLTVTNASDGGIVSPSGRAYSRHRVNTRGLHLNLFIDFLLSGKNIESNPGDPEMALRATLSSTKYRPSSDVFTYLYATDSPVNAYLRLSATHDDIISYLEKEDAPIDVFASIIWNYGMYIPPGKKNVKKIVDFMDTYNIWKHPHFKAMNGVRKFFGRHSCGTSSFTNIITGVSSCFIPNDLLKAARLTNAVLSVYKEGDVIISTLIGYNSGLPCFQQWPFAINLAGVPVWCGYGSVGTGGMSCFGNKEAGKELSTARLFPKIQHMKNRLVANYTASSLWLTCSSISLKPQMHWPIDRFDSHGKHHNWTWAMKRTAVVAYKIQKSKVDIIVRDLEQSKQTLTDFLVTLDTVMH